MQLVCSSDGLLAGKFKMLYAIFRKYIEMSCRIGLTVVILRPAIEAIMKKIENILFWPVLILLFLSASKYGAMSTDIQYNDTYHIIPNSYVAGSFAGWLLMVIFLIKGLRRRQQVIHKKIVLTYILLTVLLLGVFLGLGFVSGGSAAGNFTTADLDALMFRNQLKLLCAEGCLLVQVIFLIYLIIQLVKKPTYAKG